TKICVFPEVDKRCDKSPRHGRRCLHWAKLEQRANPATNRGVESKESFFSEFLIVFRRETAKAEHGTGAACRQGAEGRGFGPAADLDDASGRTLPARIPARAGAGGQLSRSLLQSRPGGGGYASADPSLRLRCGDPVFRHSGGAACAGPRAEFRRGPRPADETDWGRRDRPARDGSFSRAAPSGL